jgi:hypothetical protein
MMDIYRAILETAAHIEEFPQSYDYDSVRVPPECGTPGCLIGWINFYTHTHSDARHTDGGFVISADALGLRDTAIFYQRMIVLARDDDSPNWTRDPAMAARLLRRYAEKYHAPAALDPAYVKLRDSLEVPAAETA